MWAVIAIILFVIVVVGFWRRAGAGHRELGRILRACFECFAISNRMMLSGQASRRSLSLWQATGVLANIYMESFPRTAALHVAALKRLQDDDVPGALELGCEQLNLACLRWATSVPMDLQNRTIRQGFGANAEHFARALGLLHEEMHVINRQFLSDLGINSMAA